ncbi:MAG: methionine--tRNA ligase, partial [Synergistaceae bacterium]|nr:methionine--tRNA ligase [Synergistaceae bacterium]
MNDEKIFYITTPIYYVNDIPHIGHAYTTIACDAASRYKRMKAYDVHFLTGTDEHGQKIQVAAEKKGKTPQELVDEIHLNFKKLWKVLNISNNDFIRTTEPRHIKVVQKIFKQLMDQGDIYKGTYTGYYCVPCETYVPESSMGPNKTCPDCGRPLTIMEEESYFFRGSKYVPELIKFYEEHVKAVMPKIRYNEIMSFLKGGVKDQSVSRTTLKWGIPVPGDEKHVIYVWFDALINYITAAGYLDDPEKFSRYWPHVRHMVGKDIIRFHCVTWPLMLLALGINLPVEIMAHGWWTYNGEKMSKSRGNVVDPFKMVEEYGLDPFRYFLLREVPFGNDGDFSELALVGRINSDLANDLGNLLNRTLQMIKSYRDGVVPACPSSESELSAMSKNILERVDEAMNNFAFDEALKSIWEFISRANKFIDETSPWKLAKEDSQAERLDFVLLNLYEALRLAGLLIAPVMPDTAKKIYQQLGIDSDPVENLYENFSWGQGAGNKINKAEVLFPRIDINEWKKSQEAKKLQEEKETSAAP